MTVHPSLQTYADAWTHSIEAIAELVQAARRRASGTGRTPCPGWSVRDIVSHVIGMECEMLGDPRPIHTLPRDLYHVQSEFARVHGDAGRRPAPPHRAGDDLRAGVHDHPPRPAAAQRVPRPGHHGPRARSAPSRPSKWPCGMRAFDVWVHEQDLRGDARPAGQPRLPRRARHPGRPARRAAEGGRQGRGRAGQFGGGPGRARPGGVPADGPGRRGGPRLDRRRPVAGPGRDARDGLGDVRTAWPAAGSGRRRWRTGSRPRATRSWPRRSCDHFAVTP